VAHHFVVEPVRHDEREGGHRPTRPWRPSWHPERHHRGSRPNLTQRPRERSGRRPQGPACSALHEPGAGARRRPGT
jgi:hypothetical protein